MSRFWAGDSSASDDSNASSSNYSSDDASEKNANNKWVALSESSDSSDDHGRVVKSGQLRALETFQNLIAQLQKSMRARDYYAIQTQFDELAKSMIKYKQYLADGVPKPLVKMLVDLEDYVAERLLDKVQFQTLSARQGRALNRMKLTLKKHNKAYAVVIAEYKKNPIVTSPIEEEDDEDSSSSSSSSGSSDSGKAATPSKKKAAAVVSSDASSSDSSASSKSDDEDGSGVSFRVALDDFACICVCLESVSQGCHSVPSVEHRIPRFRWRACPTFYFADKAS
jgi:translation initiation factor 3 subunit C